MLRELSVAARSHPLRAPFRISRGTKTAADVVVASLRQDGCTGRGEGVPYPRYGESMASVLAQVESVRDALDEGMEREELQARLAPGAARNAVDAALWDLESRLSGVPVWTRLGEAPPAPLATAYTVSLDAPGRMAQAAAAIGDGGLIKVKVDAHDPASCVRAVRHATPRSRLIVDANESWDIDVLRDVLPALVEARVALIEQPLPAGADDALAGFTSPIPICADEACHVTGDIARLRGRYQAVNIKLDKTGGLTEAWRLLHAARGAGFIIMVGCMVCSSLGIAPALEVARHAAFVDLDGPLWLAADDPGGVRLADGMLQPPSHGFWGG